MASPPARLFVNPTCRHCGASTSPEARFCASCGASLRAGDGERRHVSVFFCDLVGSSVLAARLDVEVYRRIIQAYRDACHEVAIGHGGSVAFQPGDGILGYFGFPAAHEDDAVRAVRTGLAIAQRVSGIALEGQKLRVRVGIHTGVAAVGGSDDTVRGDDILGRIPNDAADLQGHASPGTVLISDSTRSLIAGHFDTEDVGEVPLKGGRVHAFRVIREREGVSRFDAHAAHGLTPLTGRVDEARQVRDLWTEARNGACRSLLVWGEPGMGKSRLLGVARDAAIQDGCEVVVVQCSADHANHPFGPIAELFERRLDLSRDDSSIDRLAAIERYVAQLGLDAAVGAELLAPLLGVPVDEIRGSKPLTPAGRLQKTLDLLCDLLGRLSGGAAQLILVEDLHWADPSTVDLLGRFLSKPNTSPLLLAMSSRGAPTEAAEIATRSTVINVLPMEPADARHLIDRLTGERRLPAAVTQDILTRSAGVPLFVEAITRTVLESGHLRAIEDRYELIRPIPPNLIPPTIHGPLEARIGALGDGSARRVAQMAATFGRDFTVHALRAVSRDSEDEIDEALRAMVRLDLVSSSGPNGEYSFRHALLQDAAYDSLLEETRRGYHASISRYLLETHPEVARAKPELIARHLEGGGQSSAAMDYWIAAGMQAGERSAARECVAYLRKALALLESVPMDDPRRVQKEMTAQLALAPALMATNGWASEGVEEACARARDLCRRTGNQQGLVSAIWGLWTVHLVRGELDAALDAAKAVLAMARPSDDPLLLIAAAHSMAFTHYFRGEFADARRYAEEGLEHFDIERERTLLRLLQLPPCVCCLLVLTQTLRFAGFIDEAARRNEEMLALLRSLENPAADIVGYGIGMYYDFDRRDAEAIERKSETALKLSLAEGFVFWEGGMQVYHGWALCMRMACGEGLQEIRGGLHDFLRSGAGLTLGAMHFMLAEALRVDGRQAEALEALSTARDFVEKMNERYFEAEIYRLTGEILLDTGFDAKGEDNLRTAMEVARRQGATLLELRAALVLARRLHAMGRSRDVVELLQPLRARLTEGLNEPPLRESALLLQICAQAVG